MKVKPIPQLPMKISKILSAIICIIILVLGVANFSFASKASEQLAKADAALHKAEQAKRSTDKEEYYKKALDTYNEIVSTKQNQGTPEGAKAMYGIAVVNETAPGKMRNLNTSYTTLKSLVSQYDKPAKDLEENLTRSEVTEVQQVVQNAKAKEKSVAGELDKENSKGILYKIIDFFVHLTGANKTYSYWLAILIVTIIVKIITAPLTKKQFTSMKEMQKVAPLIKEIQEKHKGDQKTIGEKTMEIYKEHHINPFASCLPVLIQMPILMLMFYMIRSYEIQLANGSFLWIGSALSHKLSFNLPAFGGMGGTVWLTAKNLAEPDLILVVLYLISMFISTRMSNVDPAQAEQQKMMAIMMPLMFSFIFAGYPSAFLLYWLVLNVIQTAQQYMILKSGREEALVPAAAPVIEQKSDSGEQPRVRRKKRR